MKVEPWSPSVGAKGMLQQAWFRVKDIPPDQRSVRTLAKVGGLVGKVLEIDEILLDSAKTMSELGLLVEM